MDESLASGLETEGEELEFSGYYGAASWCRVYVRRPNSGSQNGKSVVVACDARQSVGTSVTNRVEVVADLVCSRFGIESGHLVLIQYHPPSPVGGERFDLVSFRQSVGEFRYPQWTNLTRHQAAFLWGCGLPF